MTIYSQRNSIVSFASSSPVDGCLTENYYQKPLGRYKSVKSLLLKVVESQTRSSRRFRHKMEMWRGGGLSILEFEGHG